MAQKRKIETEIVENNEVETTVGTESKISDYVVAAYDGGMVMSYINKGYRPIGGVAILNGNFFQALIKEN